MICPCKDCSKRYATCHSTCKDYKGWKELMASKKNKNWDQTQIDYYSQPFSSYGKKRRTKGGFYYG